MGTSRPGTAGAKGRGAPVSPSTVAETSGAPSTRKRRILIIEDNADAAECLGLSLEFDGHEVAVAHAGPDGLERARELSPDVVLCDIGLPLMDGYEIAKALRSEPGTRDAYLVALSGYGLPDDRRRSTDAGFDAHLTKPATVQQLQAVLERTRGRDPG